MSRLRLVIASLLLSSAAGCAAASAGTAVGKPVAVQPAKPAVDRAALRAKLAERRAITMSHFLAYRENRVYPLNNLPGGGLRHVWQDDNGNLCAAATLISWDWGFDSTVNVGKENREIALAKVASGPLADWILTSGLTHHEIVAIQVPGSEMFPMPVQRNPEIERLYGIYLDVERQLTGLHDESLDLATDALMKRPDLARELLAGHVASAGKYTAKTAVATK
jgi:hypothetical protein